MKSPLVSFCPYAQDVMRVVLSMTRNDLNKWEQGGYFMSDLATSITNSLLQLRGKSAKHMTHALKMLGGGENGSMVDGALRIVSALDDDKKMCVREAKRNYGIGGALIGMAATGIIGGGAWLYSKRKKKKEHQEECKKIEQVFDNEVKLAAEEKTDADSEKNSE